MISDKFRRCLSAVMVMVLIFTLVPFQATATETASAEIMESFTEEFVFETEANDTKISETTSEEVSVTVVSDETEPSADELLQDYQTQIYDILTRYLGTISMSTEDIYSAVAQMDDAYVDALMECYDLEETITAAEEDEQLTEEEIHCLLDSNDAFLDFSDALAERYEQEYSISLFATDTAEVANGSITIQYNTTYANVLNGTVSVSITGGLASRYNTTVTLINATSETVSLAFDYAASNYYNFTIAGTTPGNDSDSYSVDLAVNGSIALYIQSNRRSSGAATLTISNIKVVTEADATLDYDSSLGSVTVGGTAVADGEKATVPKEGTTMVATPASGATFLGWVNSADSSLISSSASYQLTLDQDMTIKAVFVNSGSVPYFRVGTAYLFDNLTDAINCTGTSGIKTIISVNDGTLAAGNYTIPSDVTLLIPFDSADTISTDSPNDSAMASTSVQSVYRTLTVPSDATITCEGILNVNGQRKTTGQSTTGTAQGKHGKLVLNGSGTQLTIASGGKLYCYGYICGTGRVEIAQGGEMHELLQLCDWPGGTNASNWNSVSDEDTLFLSARYFVQNVESPLRINYGAYAYCEAILYVSSQTILSSSLFIAPSGSSQGLFLMGNGTYLDRAYDPSTDRVTYSLCATDKGTFTFGSIEVELSDTIKALLKILQINLDLNSSSYILPINNAMTINIKPGVTINMGNRVAVLPGAEVIVDKDAILNLTNHAIIFDIDDWTDDMSYGTQKALPYTAGRGTNAALTITQSGCLQVDGTLNISGDGGIYTTTGITSSSTTSDNTDKIIYGTGTIIHNGAQGTGALKTGYNSTQYEITISNALGNLAGVGEMQTFSKSTYYGLGPDHNNYWYETKTVYPATCESDAYTVYNCSGGTGYTVTNQGSALDHNYDDGVVTTPATCTSAGIKTYTCQNDSSHTYTETIAALGHTEVESIQDETLPTYNAGGSYVEVVNCSVCDNELSRTKVTIPKVAQLSALAASAAEEIILDLKFNVPDTVTEITVSQIRKSGDSTTTIEKTYKIEDITAESADTGAYVDGSGRYVFSRAVASGEMTMPVSVSFKSGSETVYVLNGKNLSDRKESVSYTVQDYAKIVLDTEGDSEALTKQQKIVTSLVTYGGYAQSFFETYTDKPAYSILGTEAPDVSSVSADTITAWINQLAAEGKVHGESGDDIGIKESSEQSFLASAIYHRVYFTLTGEYDISKFTFAQGVPVNNKDAYTTPLSCTEEVLEGGAKRYYVDILDIPAAYLDYVYTITVTNTETKETYTYKTSVLSYLQKILAQSEAEVTGDNLTAMSAQKNLARAMYLYNQEANTFFGK